MRTRKQCQLLNHFCFMVPQRMRKFPFNDAILKSPEMAPTPLMEPRGPPLSSHRGSLSILLKISVLYLSPRMKHFEQKSLQVIGEWRKRRTQSKHGSCGCADSRLLVQVLHPALKSQANTGNFPHIMFYHL